MAKTRYKEVIPNTQCPKLWECPRYDPRSPVCTSRLYTKCRHLYVLRGVVAR